MSFSRTKSVKCRKPHRCEWCGEQVEKGETAVYSAGTFEGDFYSYHMHNECDKAVQKSVDDMEPGWGDFSFMPHDQERGKTYDECHG